MGSAELLLEGRDGARQVAGRGSAWTQEMGVYAKRVEIRTSGAITTIYKGWAEYGSSEGSTSWMIAEVILDTTTELDVTEGIAGGVSNKFDFTWSGRAGHTYT